MTQANQVYLSGSSAFLGELYDGEEEDPVQSAGGLVDCCASRGLRTSTDSDLGSLPYADDQNMACLLWFGPVTQVHELDVTGAPFCVLPLPTRTSNILSPRRRGSIVVPEQSSSRCQPTYGRSPLSWCFPCLAESSNVLGVDCTLCLAFGACLGSATTVLARTSSGIPTASDVMGKLFSLHLPPPLMLTNL